MLEWLIKRLPAHFACAYKRPPFPNKLDKASFNCRSEQTLRDTVQLPYYNTSLVPQAHPYFDKELRLCCKGMSSI